MREVWKDIEGFEGLYKISNSGKIRNIKRNKLLKCTLTGHGYNRAVLFKDGKRFGWANVGRLVLINFIGDYPELQCNHIDGNKQNNHISNLEWVTGSENCKHRDKLGLRKRAVKKHSEESKQKMRKSRLKNSHLYKRDEKGQFVCV